MKSFLRGLKLFGAFVSLFAGCYLAYLVQANPQPLADLFQLILMLVLLAIGATILWLEWK